MLPEIQKGRCPKCKLDRLGEVVAVWQDVPGWEFCSFECARRARPGGIGAPFELCDQLGLKFEDEAPSA